MNLKTIIILIILAVPVGYSLKKLFGMFKSDGGGCECASCPVEKKNCCSSKK
jgi:hypothetical protein